MSESRAHEAMKHDPELESLVQEALSLRLKMNEIAQAAGITNTVLWRWRYYVNPAWDRREQALAGIRELIKATRDEYLAGSRNK